MLITFDKKYIDIFGDHTWNWRILLLILENVEIELYFLSQHTQSSSQQPTNNTHTDNSHLARILV